MATLGLLAALQPVLTRLAARHGRAAVIRMAAVAGLALGGLLGVFGIAVLLLPDDVAELLVGPGWDEASQFVAPLTVSAVMGAVGGCLGLDAAHAGVSSAARFDGAPSSAPRSVAVIAAGTLLFGAETGLWILAASGAVTSLVWAALLATPARDGRDARDDTPVPAA